jgi:hypothetical protein
LADETRRLAKVLNDTTVFATSGSGTRDDYRLRVQRYEAATEIMTRAFGVIGRWGDESAYGMAAEVIGDFAFLRVEGGLNWWLDLRFYPAIILFYAFGLGALKAGRYVELFSWFTLSVRRDQRTSQPFIERLVVWNSETYDRWKMLEGLENNKTPFSDHMHDILIATTADITLADRERTRIFETFELLAGLAFLTIAASIEELREAQANRGQSGLVWAPIGRAGWDSGTSTEILAQMEGPEMQQVLLEAGFSHGDKEHLDLALGNIRRLMGNMRF